MMAAEYFRPTVLYMPVHLLHCLHNTFTVALPCKIMNHRQVMVHIMNELIMASLHFVHLRITGFCAT